jgi:hypothetical protein
MTNFFYTDANGSKQGPVSEQQLKELATQRLINPNTPMETDTGHQGTAGQIPGLFDAPNPFTVSPFTASAPAPIATAVSVPPTAGSKESITSGIPLTATPADLHSLLVYHLSESPYIPLDVFEKTEVIREERYYVPAYCFDCSGTTPFTYEAGNERQQVVVRSDGKSSWEETRRHMEWTTMSSNASFTGALFATGYKELGQQIRRLYSRYDSTGLKDIKEFPADVVTYDYNLPQTAAFNEYIQPSVKKRLRNRAEDSLIGKIFRGLSMGGSKIDKDVTSVYLGLIHVVYKYGGKEYSMWATGGGKYGWLEDMPKDPQRKAAYDNKQAKAQAKPSYGEPKKLGCLGICSTLLGISFSLFVLLVVFLLLSRLLSYLNRENEDMVQTTGVPILMVGDAIVTAVFAILAAVFFIPLWRIRRINRGIEKDNAQLLAQLAEDMADFEAFDAKRLAAIQSFKRQRVALRGIYEKVSDNYEVSDNAEAF